MKNIIIVGAGGLAKDLYSYISIENKNIALTGILVDNIDDYKKSAFSAKYLGKLSEYEPKENDYFLIAIGENPGRKKVLEMFKKKKSKFYTLIHPSAIVHPSAMIEEGVIIGPFCVIGSNAHIGSNSFINKFSNIGHDVKLGENCIMYPYSMIGGNAVVGSNTILSTRSTIAPKLNIGNNCTISAHTFIRKNLENNFFVFNLQDLKIKNNSDK